MGTNVFMSIGTDWVVICLDAVHEKNRDIMESKLRQTGRTVVNVTWAQVENLAANCYELLAKDGRKKLVISTRGWASLRDVQKENLRQKADIVTCKVDTIEAVGGGGIRCMIAPIFCIRKSQKKICSRKKKKKKKKKS